MNDDRPMTIHERASLIKTVVKDVALTTKINGYEFEQWLYLIGAFSNWTTWERYHRPVDIDELVNCYLSQYQTRSL